MNFLIANFFFKPDSYISDKLVLLNPLKLMENTLYFTEKVFSFLRYLNFCSDFFGHVGQRVDKIANVKFKIHDVANWKTNKYIMHIAQ